MGNFQIQQLLNGGPKKVQKNPKVESKKNLMDIMIMCFIFVVDQIRLLSQYLISNAEIWKGNGLLTKASNNDIGIVYKRPLPQIYVLELLLLV